MHHMTGGGSGRAALILKLRCESTSHPSWFPSRERHGIHWTGVWVEPRAGMDVLKKRESLAPSVSQPQIFHPVVLLLHPIHYPGIYTSHRHCNMQLFEKQINTQSLTEVKNLTVFQTSVHFLSYRRYALTWILNNEIWSPPSTQK